MDEVVSAAVEDVVSTALAWTVAAKDVEEVSRVVGTDVDVGVDASSVVCKTKSGSADALVTAAVVAAAVSLGDSVNTGAVLMDWFSPWTITVVITTLVTVSTTGAAFTAADKRERRVSFDNCIVG